MAMRTVLGALLSCLLVPAAARADEVYVPSPAVFLPSAPAPDAAPSASVERPVVTGPEEALPMWGAQLDAGIPDGLGASLAIRPFTPHLRLTAGGITNGASAGLRAGLTLVSVHGPFAPTLSLEAGRLFDGDANTLDGPLTSAVGTRGSIVERIGYDFASAQLGVELGLPDRVVFTLRGGLSYVDGALLMAPQTLGRGAFAPGDVNFQLVTLSAKAGLLIYLD